MMQTFFNAHMAAERPFTNIASVTGRINCDAYHMVQHHLTTWHTCAHQILQVGHVEQHPLLHTFLPSCPTSSYPLIRMPASGHHKSAAQHFASNAMQQPLPVPKNVLLSYDTNRSEDYGPQTGSFLRGCHQVCIFSYSYTGGHLLSSPPASFI